MMYLGIFVFAACTTFGLVQSEKAPFMCPVCQAEGDNAYSECEANIEYKPCLEQDPVCVLRNYTSPNPDMPLKIVERFCTNRRVYNYMKIDCQTEFRGSFNVVMCDTSGCRAEFRFPGKPFFCPICFTWGENADSDCEAHTQNKPCYEADPVCVLVVKSANPAEYMEREIMRFCMDKTFYNQKNWLHDCETYRDCNKVMCETSGCKA
ncbi:uncharacterized protein LOC144665550 [Oculina patagonica]